MSATMIAIDLGAESGRAIGGTFDGSRLELNELRRFPTRCVQLPDGLYWDVHGLYAEILQALEDSARAGTEIRSIGIDSWAVDFGLVDERGALVHNPLSYRDGRGATAIDGVLSQIPLEELYEITGIQLLPINTVFQLRSLPEIRGANGLLLLPDLLGFWLTGERLAEETNASTTQLLDARTGDWAWELIDRLGFPRSLFPPVTAPGTVRGGLLPHVADTTGLSSATPVVTVASHDTASAVVAAPLAGEGAAFISSGTWSLVGVELAAPVLSREARDANLTNERGFAGTTRLLKNVMGLWLLQECRRAWNREGQTIAYRDFPALAQSASASFLFDPDFPELLTPGHMPNRICAAAGSSAANDVAVVGRSIFESLACKYRTVIEQLEAVTGQPIRTLNVIGGGARNAYLCQLTADVTGRVVVAGPEEASALGNLLVQMSAFGDVGSLGEMRDVVRASTTLTTYEPDTQRGRWDELYGRFVEILEPKAVAS